MGKDIVEWIRESHTQHSDGLCTNCLDDWPCPTARLLAAYDELAGKIEPELSLTFQKIVDALPEDMRPMARKWYGLREMYLEQLRTRVRAVGHAMDTVQVLANTPIDEPPE